MDRLADKAAAAITPLHDVEIYGKVTKILGLLIEIAGFGNNRLAVGSRVDLCPKPHVTIACEVIASSAGVESLSVCTGFRMLKIAI